MHEFCHLFISFFFLIFFFFFFGIRSPMTSKREIKWCMVADWLKCDRLLFTFCGICITSNSAKSTPRTNPSPCPRSPWHQWVLAGLQDAQAHTTPSLEHKKQHWETWRHLKLRHLAASAWINLFLLRIIFYLHFVCMRGRVRRHRRGRGFSQDLFQNEFKLANTVWHIRGGAGHCSALVLPDLAALGRQTAK